jgi:large subunit ribosomal protein L4
MPSVDVIDLSNKKVGHAGLADAVFGAPVNEALLYEAVRHHLAGTRRGTAKTKTRHEVAGSGKKLWKQKGTGRAAWVRSAALCGAWRHDARSATARLFLQTAPKDAVGRSAQRLSRKLRDGELRVVSEFAIASQEQADAQDARTVWISPARFCWSITATTATCSCPAGIWKA